MGIFGGPGEADIKRIVGYTVECLVKTRPDVQSSEQSEPGNSGIDLSGLIDLMGAMRAELVVQIKGLNRKIDAIPALVDERVEKAFTIASTESRRGERAPVVKSVVGLESFKTGNEILSTLFEKLPTGTSPSRLRPFFTDLERETGIPLTQYHRDVMKAKKAKDGSGKYPYRKIDTVLKYLDPSYVHGYVKGYEFSYK